MCSHCRLCGHLCCDECTPHMLPLSSPLDPSQPSGDLLKACSLCSLRYMKHAQPQANAVVFDLYWPRPITTWANLIPFLVQLRQQVFSPLLHDHGHCHFHIDISKFRSCMSAGHVISKTHVALVSIARRCVCARATRAGVSMPRVARARCEQQCPVGCHHAR